LPCSACSCCWWECRSGRAALAGGALGLWANLHGTFLIGFGVIGAAVLAWALARRWRASAWAIGALTLGGGGSLLSPNGPVALWRGPFATVSGEYLSYNRDWIGLKPFSVEGAAVGLLIVAVCCLGAGRRDDPRTIAAAGLLLPAIQLARFSPFLALLLGIIVTEWLLARFPGLTLPEGSPQRHFIASRRAAVVAWGIVLTGLLGAGALAQATAAAALADPAAAYPSPRGATDALLACGEPAPIWNDYNWGGYLLWRGEGRFPVGIDGRAETLYPDRIFARYVRVLQGQPGWEAIVQDSPARYAMVTTDAFATIERLPGWRLVYRDDAVALSAREGAAWGCPVPGGR